MTQEIYCRRYIVRHFLKWKSPKVYRQVLLLDSVMPFNSHIDPQPGKLMIRKDHDFTQQEPGNDYILELADEASESKGFYMTGQRLGIKLHDHIILQTGSDIVHYRVESIDYYIEPPDMWLAFLVKES